MSNASTGGLVASSDVNTDGKKIPPLRLGLLGAGTFAKSAHFSVLSRLEASSSVHIHLVWSRRSAASHALAAQYGRHVVAAHAESLVRADADDVRAIDDATALESASVVLRKHRMQLDAVVLAVPIPHNAAYTRLVLAHGLHVFCEKPLSHDVPSAHSLLSSTALPPASPPAAAAAPLHTVGENFRFEPAFKRARLLIPGICGTVLALRLSAQTPMPAGSRYACGWRLDLPDAGILTDGFVHNVAALRLLASSDVARIDSARCARHASHFAGSDTVVSTLTFANGLPASIFATYACAAFHWELVVVGTQGDVILQRLQGKPGYDIICRDGSSMQSLSFEPFSGLEVEFDAFVTSCHKGELHPDLSARSAFNDLAAVHSMFESSVGGCSVKVPTLPSQTEPSTLQSSFLSHA